MSGARLNIPLPEEISHIAPSERAHLVDITLDSDRPDTTRRVGALAFGRFVASFQRLIDALGQAKLGRPSSQGPIPGSILERTKLDMIAGYTGSFGVRFETQEHDDMLGHSLARDCLEALFGLLAVEDDPTGLMIQLQELRSRVASNYQNLLDAVQGSIPIVRLNWTPPGHGPSRHAVLTQEAAKSIYDRIQAVRDTIQDDLEMTGRLIGGNVRSLFFEIHRLDDGHRFLGRIHESVVNKLDTIPLGTACRVVLSPRLEVSEATGEERTRYELVDIEGLRDPT